MAYLRKKDLLLCKLNIKNIDFFSITYMTKSKGDLGNNYLDISVLQCKPHMGIISIAWRRFRNANSPDPPQNY